MSDELLSDFVCMNRRYKPLGLGLSKAYTFEYPASVADPSFFVPTAEALKVLEASERLAQAAGTAVGIARELYDFSDGMDTGANPPIARRKGVDIAEISDIVRRETDALQSALSDYQARQAELSKEQVSQASQASQASPDVVSSSSD